MQIKKIYIVLLIIVNTSCRNGNEENLSKKQSLVKFQKELINKEITGSNEIVIFKDNLLFYRHSENTNNKYDKKSTQRIKFNYKNDNFNLSEKEVSHIIKTNFASVVRLSEKFISYVQYFNYWDAGV